MEEGSQKMQAYQWICRGFLRTLDPQEIGADRDKNRSVQVSIIGFLLSRTVEDFWHKSIALHRGCLLRSCSHQGSEKLTVCDYSRAGAYFFSICTKDRKCLFGEIVNQEMVLNNVGSMITNIWNELPQRFPNIELIENVIMPNHIHCTTSIVSLPL